MVALGMFIAVAGANIATGSGPLAFAGDTQEPTADPCIQPTSTPDFKKQGETPNDDCLPSGGPDLTPTAGPTDTPVPEPTDAPPPPPAATSTPSGDAGAGAVAPPNTGDGSSLADTATRAMLFAGLLLVVAGGGFVLAGARRRS
jgi:hypothetical protein